MNRAERRMYVKEKKNDPMASYCQVCRGKTLHYSRPTEKNLYNTPCDIVCECCGTIARFNLAGITPMVYVRLDMMPEPTKEERA